MAAHGSTLAHPAVIETSPARIPLVRALKSRITSLFCPVILYRVKKVRIPAAEGARMEFTIASFPPAPESPLILPDEPPLKRSHPSQRIRVPRHA